MYRARHLAALLMIVIGSTWITYSLILKYTHITKPYFVWVLGAVVMGIVLRKVPTRR